MKSNKNANHLRKNLTDAERRIWLFLKNRNLEGHKFRRQVPLGNYIADFCCMEKKLVIELDGGQHNFDSNIKRDKIRDKFLEDNGYKVLRFWNNEVLSNTEGVLETIRKTCFDLPLTRPAS